MASLDRQLLSPRSGEGRSFADDCFRDRAHNFFQKHIIITGIFYFIFNFIKIHVNKSILIKTYQTQSLIHTLCSLTKNIKGLFSNKMHFSTFGHILYSSYLNMISPLIKKRPSFPSLFKNFKMIFLFIFSQTTFLIFFPASARTWIISTDFFRTCCLWFFCFFFCLLLMSLLNICCCNCSLQHRLRHRKGVPCSSNSSSSSSSK